MQQIEAIETYEQACQAVQKAGILPLSSFIPGFPSLESLTLSAAWHTGLESDPWLWRARLPEEGVAAYGRFFAGKPLLVARELFPYLRNTLKPERSVQERFEDGLLSRASMRVFEAIGDVPGIDARELRKAAGLGGREDKSAFDEALIDLQKSGEVVISGTHTRLDEQGNKSGWSSTCYMRADHWLDIHRLAGDDSSALMLSQTEASQQLFARLEPHWPAEALKYVRKKLG